jgi:hypothetical protein
LEQRFVHAMCRQFQPAHPLDFHRARLGGVWRSGSRDRQKKSPGTEAPGD